MKRLSRITAGLLAMLMILALAACTKAPTETGTALSDGATVKLVTLSNPSWPLSDDCKAWEYIREGTGMNLEVQIIPDSDYYSKVPLMFAAPETLPDLMTFDNKASSDKYVVQGALIALDDMEEYMPNYNAFIASLSEKERETLVTTRKAADGKVYYSPTHGRESMQGMRAWMYRKDIFEKHNLKVPENKDEFVDVCRELKKLYPDSYPFSMRNGLNYISMIGPQWKPHFSNFAYYDFESEKWSYGAIEPTMLEILTFLKQMVDEKLLPADFMTINTQTWQELITTDRGFIFPDFQTRIDFFTPLARTQNPNFTLTAMIPPVMNEETGTNKIGRFNIDPYGFVLCNTKDEKRIKNAAKYLDWMFSDEACELLTWGKEGETYNVVDGKRVYITDETGAQPNTLYGFSLPGTIARFDSDAVDAFESEFVAAGRHITTTYIMDEVPPTMWLSFNEEETKVMEVERVEIETYTREMMSKFMLGMEPLSKFDEFVETINEMGVEKLLAAYESAYNRVK